MDKTDGCPINLIEAPMSLKPGLQAKAHCAPNTCLLSEQLDGVIMP